MRNQSIRRLVGTGLAVGGLTLGVLAGPVSSGASTSRVVSTLDVALPPGSVPTSTFPFYSAEQCTTTNIDYWNLEVRPGYWFGLGASVSLIPALSPLNAPTIKTVGANTSVSFTTKGWKWSNGSGTSAMDAEDVAFFLNMDKAQKAQGSNAFCGYAPGFGIPDQVVSVSYPQGLGGQTTTIVLAGHPATNWITYNELSQIVPLDHSAWDRTSGGAANCAGEAFASVKTDGSDACSNVFNYLENLNINNALWDWSDGPYRQTQAQYSSGQPDGNDIQVANTDYSGTVKAHAVKTIVYKPYTQTSAEVADLQSNKLDFGYADPSDVSKSPGPGKAGHNLLPHMTNFNAVGTLTFGVFYWMFNFDNSNSTWDTHSNTSWGVLNNQQYFRAALQQSENQAQVITHVENGYAVQTYSAIPTYPKNSNNKGVTNPYPYSTTKGKALMKANGWNVNVFPAQCAKANCGTSQFPISSGTKAIETVLVPSGDSAVTTQTQDEINSIKAGADIEIVADYELATTVQAACFGGAALWELCGYGGWIYAPDYYPSGEVLFAAGSSSNSGGYGSAEMNGLIHATTTNGSLALNAKDPSYGTSFAEYTATAVPFLWQPTPAGFIEQAKSVKGAQTPNPLGDFNPEYITTI